MIQNVNPCKPRQSGIPLQLLKTLPIKNSNASSNVLVGWLNTAKWLTQYPKTSFKRTTAKF